MIGNNKQDLHTSSKLSQLDHNNKTYLIDKSKEDSKKTKNKTVRKSKQNLSSKTNVNDNKLNILINSQYQLSNKKLLLNTLDNKINEISLQINTMNSSKEQLNTKYQYAIQHKKNNNLIIHDTIEQLNQNNKDIEIIKRNIGRLQDEKKKIDSQIKILENHRNEKEDNHMKIIKNLALLNNATFDYDIQKLNNQIIEISHQILLLSKQKQDFESAVNNITFIENTKLLICDSINEMFKNKNVKIDDNELKDILNKLIPDNTRQILNNITIKTKKKKQ